LHCTTLQVGRQFGGKESLYQILFKYNPIIGEMSSVKNTAEFLRTLGLSSNFKTKELVNDSSGGYSPQDVAKELFLTPEKKFGNLSGSK
jgi:hypothetical protein